MRRSEEEREAAYMALMALDGEQVDVIEWTEDLDGVPLTVDAGTATLVLSAEAFGLMKFDDEEEA